MPKGKPPGQRPRHQELAEFFSSYKQTTTVGWSAEQLKANPRNKPKRFPKLTYNTLLRLGSGQIRWPSEDTLRQFCEFNGVDYNVVISALVAINYHAGVAPADVDARKLAELDRELAASKRAEQDLVDQVERHKRGWEYAHGKAPPAERKTAVGPGRK